MLSGWDISACWARANRRLETCQQAAQKANPASKRTTQLYNRPAEEVTLDEVVRNFV
jgi:hypothetical protein